MEKTYITKYLMNGDYCILTPVYNNYEIKPAWHKLFVGSLAECKQKISDYPDFYNDLDDAKTKHILISEYLFLKDHNKKEMKKLIDSVKPEQRHIFNL